jgi:hypothetical protein
VHILSFHKRGIGMTNQAQICRWVGSQNELEITLMRIVAANTIAVCDRLVDVVSCR